MRVKCFYVCSEAVRLNEVVIKKLIMSGAIAVRNSLFPLLCSFKLVSS